MGANALLLNATFIGFDAILGYHCIEHRDYCSRQTGRYSEGSFVIIIIFLRQCRQSHVLVGRAIVRAGTESPC